MEVCDDWGSSLEVCEDWAVLSEAVDDLGILFSAGGVEDASWGTWRDSAAARGWSDSTTPAIAAIIYT